jgi:alpha-aminoadipic semialdehyde synthase
MDGKPYKKQDYRNNPHEYTDCFKDYLSCVSWLVNGIYWEAKYPRVITKDTLKKAVVSGNSRLMGVTDISADYEGSVEFTSRFTSIEEPFLLYDPVEMKFKEKINDFVKDEILFHSVDHLPAEMPQEASNHFGEKLFPFVEAVVKSDFNIPWEQVNDLPTEIYNAVIAADGKLTPQYNYIANLRAINERTKKDESDGSSVGA